MLLRLDDTNPKMKEFLGGVTGGVGLGEIERGTSSNASG